MKWIEVYFWTLVYWALYAPIAGVITLITDSGGLLELLGIGLLMTILVVICLWQMEGVLFFDYDTPTIVLTEPLPQAEAALPVEPVPTPAKRGRKPKKTEQKPEEVPNEEENEFVEPEPAMRTDIAFAELNADGVLS